MSPVIRTGWFTQRCSRMLISTYCGFPLDAPQTHMHKLTPAQVEGR